MKPNSEYGLIAEFKTVSSVKTAASQVRDAGFKSWDVLTPFPIHGLDADMGLKRSKVPVFTLIGGTSGFLLGMLMIWFMNAYDYPLIVGGKPFFSPIYPFPVMYELTILLSAFGTFFGMFLTNKLPRHHHPVFNHPGFSRATDDHFWILIEAKDPLYNTEKTKQFLSQIGGADVSILNH